MQQVTPTYAHRYSMNPRPHLQGVNPQKSQSPKILDQKKLKDDPLHLYGSTHLHIIRALIRRFVVGPNGVFIICKNSPPQHNLPLHQDTCHLSQGCPCRYVCSGVDVTLFLSTGHPQTVFTPKGTLDSDTKSLSNHNILPVIVACPKVHQSCS